ncbi:MAG: VWA domain-containing protein [Halobacteriaceae archaeon]
MSPTIRPELDSTELPPSGGTPTAEVSFSTGGKARVTSRQVVLCVDTSGSMGVSDDDGVKKIERARRGARQVLDELAPDDYLAVVGFTSTASVLAPMSRWGDTSAASVESTIADMEATNGTDIEEGIEAARRQFDGLPAGPSVVRRIVFLSDGEDWHDPDYYRSLAEEVAEDDVAIAAAGIGGDYDEDVIIALAEGSRGSPTHLTDAADIETYFEEEISEAGSVVATRPDLHVEAGEGMRLDEAFVAPPNARTTGVETGDREATIELPDLTTDEDVRVTMRFLAPPRQGGLEHELARLRLVGDEELAAETLTVEYAEDADETAGREDIQVAHADAKVSAGIRDPDVASTDLAETVDGIERTNPDWDDVVDRLRGKLDESGEAGGSITAGIARIRPEDDDQ